MKPPDPTWECECGERHTGHVHTDFPGHLPVDRWEYLMAIMGRNKKGQKV